MIDARRINAAFERLVMELRSDGGTALGLTLAALAVGTVVGWMLVG